MPLEDFFTLTEMNDGLATLARVEELVGVIKERENIRKNAGDVPWQWSTVAGVLAATENKDCLNHFVELDGLLFLAQWLQEVQKCSGAMSDSFIEESINALLGALEKLPIDYKQPTASGIKTIVKNLFGHKSCKVQERARALFGSWNQVKDENSNCHDVDECGACLNDEPKSLSDVKLSAGGCPNSPVLTVSSLKESGEGSNVGEFAGSEFLHAKITGSSDVSQVEIMNDVKVHTSNQDMPLTILNQPDAKGFSADAKSSGSSPLPNTCSEISAVSEESSSCVGDADGKSSTVAEFKDATDGVKEEKIDTNVMVDSSSNVTEKETRDVSQSFKPKEPVSLPASPINSQKFVRDASVSSDGYVKENESYYLGSGDNILECQLKDSVVGMLTCSGKIVDLKPVGEDGECHAEGKQDLSSNGCTSRTIDGPGNSSHGKGGFRTVDVVKEPVSESSSEASGGENSVILRDILKAKMDSEDPNEMDKRNSDMEIDYGVDDALEVARLVAKEVEREVIDYRGPFCSSPEKNLEGEILQSDSPASVKARQDEPMNRPSKLKVELPTEKDLCSDASTPKAKRLRMSGDINIDPKDHRDKLESPPSTAVAQEFAGDVRKGGCDFDLNEEVDTQEVECSVVPTTNQQFTLSAPIPVVATSKGTLGLPSTPLHFGGVLGWKGSASTSAFRPASPRRTPESGDKISSVDASSNGSKQRQKQTFLEIDLNVAGDENDAAHVSLSSAFPSRESSIEGRTERLKWDLNRLGDSDDGFAFQSSDWRVDGRFNHKNGHHSQSPASSSSSRKPPMIEFDLNDNPLVPETRDSHEHWQSLRKSSLQEVKDHGSFKLDDPVVSIMGSRIDVGRKEFCDRNHLLLANVQGAEASFNYNWPRLGYGSGAQPSLAYASPPPAFSYNDLTVGHSMSFPLPMYGPTSSLPYMIDSRGATVIPPMLGTAATISTPSFSGPPLIMGLAGAPTGPSGVRATRSGLDLNSGVVTMDGECKDVGSLRQFFIHGHSGATVEQMRSSLQPAGIGMTLKQKEPECEWELSMVGHKQ